MSTSTKFYWSLCAVLAAVTLGLFATGTLTWFSITVVGFIACTLVFTGMMCVTISIVGAHANEFQHADAEPITKPEPQKQFVPASRVPAVAVQSRIAH
jgi:hypothetical protein